MDNLPGWARIFIPKAAGFIAGLLASWLSTKGITVTSENHEFIALLLVAVFTAVGGFVKTWLTAHINPANVNSPTLAVEVHKDLKEQKNAGT